MALFRKKGWINPAEYTVQKAGGATSYILDDYVSDTTSLSALCVLVCPSVAPVRKNLNVIIKSAVQKLDTISSHADQFYKDAITSSDVEVFFKDMAVVRRDLSEMKQIEKYVCYGGPSTDYRLYELENRFQIEVRHLIDRAAATVSVSASPDELAAFHLAVFKAHASELDAQSQKKLTSKYKKYIV